MPFVNIVSFRFSCPWKGDFFIMDILTLKYFIVTAQTQHMTKAAQMLNITQPALSSTIQRLESSLGCPLFDRTGRNIKLNKYGEIFLKSALQMEQIMNSCIEEINRERLNDVSCLRVACSSSPTNGRMLSYLISMGIQVDAQWVPRNWDMEIANDRLDLVLTFGKTAFKNIDRMLLTNYKIGIVADKKHPLAKETDLALKDLEKSIFCCNSSPHSLTHVLLSSGFLPDFTPKIAFQGRSVADMLAMIHSGEYLGIMVMEHLPEDDSLMILPVNDLNLHVPYYMYWKRNDRNPLLAGIRKNIADFYKKLTD